MVSDRRRWLTASLFCLQNCNMQRGKVVITLLQPISSKGMQVAGVELPSTEL
jgi:hypothetical protein